MSALLCTIAVVVGAFAITDTPDSPGGSTEWLATASAAGFLVLFFVRSHAAKVRVDAFSVTVTNRFIRHRIPWGKVTGVWVPEPGAHEFVRTLRIERRRGALFSVSVVAALGMDREQLRLAAHELAELARQHGAEIKAAGSAAEVEAQLASKPPSRDE